MQIQSGQFTRSSPLTVRFSGADASCAPQADASERVPVRYYTEANPAGVERLHFRRVRYRELYPGIDLIFRVDHGSVEFDLQLAPGANPDLVRIDYGTADTRLLNTGDIEAHSGEVTVLQRPPAVYQVINGAVVPIATHYIPRGRGVFGIRVDPYNPDLPLTIDPVLNLSAVVGGQGYDAAYAMAVDASGSIYIAGETDSLTFWGGGRRTSRDAFAMKLDSTGSKILYATFLGGSGPDAAHGLTVDGAGNAYIAGTTNSQDFPASPGVVGNKNAGFEDAFVVKLSANGSLVYSTMLGSTGSDLGLGIAVDGSGNTYITGQTTGSFPVTPGAFQTVFRGNTNCYVAKLNATATALLYSTFLGGSSQNICRAIAVDGSGNAYVAGVTFSTDFPVQGAFQSALKGTADAFVSKINPAGSALIYSTLLGGDGFDEANAIAVDPSGSAYLAGDTNSWNFPVSSGAYQAACIGGYDAFAAKLSPAGNTLGYATLIGGSGTDAAFAVAVDSAGRTMIAGSTNSVDLPVQQASQAAIGGMFDAFAAVLDSSGSTLLYGTYIGGSGDDRASAVTAAPGKKLYVAGSTQSLNFPNASQSTAPGDTDLFVVEVVGTWPDLPISVSVSPGTAALAANQTQQFTATVSNTTNPAVTWSINPAIGTISMAGLYAAPATINSSQTIKVTAVSQADGVTAGSGTISLISASAQFLKLDTTTQGSWKGVYGGDGYNVINNAVSYPSYVTPVFNGGAGYTWAANTTDVKALLQAGASGQRIAATWYTATTFTVDLPFSDTTTHQLAVYCLDWDFNNARAQKLEILDVNGNVLDSRGVTAFSTGAWVVWSVSGHVRLRVTNTGNTNAVISGLFLDPARAQSGLGTAQLAKLDTATKGSWKGVYGRDGYNVINNAVAYPSYVTPVFNGGAGYTWTAATTDARALQQAGGTTQRIAATWYTTSSFTIDLPFSDTGTHQLAVYCLDWDFNNGRAQKLEILDVNGNVLDGRSVTAFTAGTWVVWNVSGHVQLRVTNTNDKNAVISGLFFDPRPQLSAAAQFIKLDTSAQGAWEGVYGADGYNVINNSVAYPSYVTPVFNGGAGYTWASNTSDPRALLQAGASGQRIAATWYTTGTFTIDLPFTDTGTHQFAVYCLDWDFNNSRAQRMEIMDINGNVLDSRSLTAFGAGVWAVWSLSGHVQLRVTNTSNKNAVISGLFFGPG